jgi:prepilin-type N-terminal cleavage/methylation domain-containing protein
MVAFGGAAPDGRSGTAMDHDLRPSSRSIPHRLRRPDGGFTLPELVITVFVVGVVMATLSSIMVIVMRQQTSSEGRFNASRSEQSLGMWMPADLASAQAVDTAPGTRPCGPGCTTGTSAEGSNMVMLSWQTMVAPGAPPTMKTTNVSYRYVQRSGTWMVTRVQCDRTTGVSWSCGEKIVSRNIAAPPAGTTFAAGTTYPSWAIGVSQPMDPIDPGTGTTVAPTDSQAKSATRVTLNVHGGSTQSGTTGGLTPVIITAGSTKLVNDLDPASMEGAPSFSAMRSRCGGNFGLIVDASQSINASQLVSVKTGLKTLVDTFRGTPIRIQMTTFGDRGWIIGSTTGKTPRWFDMLNEADVTALKTAIDAVTTRFGTNYEEGIFRMFRNDDGTQQDVVADTVMFFTDGQVYGSRLTGTMVNGGKTWTFNTASAPTNPPGSSGHAATSTLDAQFRAEYWAGLYRGITTRFIGIGVGTVTNSANNVRSIAKIVSGNTTGVPATTDASGNFNNADVANLYTLPQWEKFAGAVEAIALAKCGGTLTVQTIRDGSPHEYPVSYQNTAAQLASGADAEVSLVTVTTSASYPSGTFDYAISSGGYLTVDIVPASLADLDGFTPVGWSCRSRGADRSFTPIPISGSTFTGIRVRVNVNEALSCKLTVQ